jgi:pimeloyl-ACP methyl ester carboxylesterase
VSGPGEARLRHFTASDGVRIAIDEDGVGRPILFLHGLMAHAGFFDRQLDLARDFRVIRADMRGHGRSVGSGSAPTVQTLADDVAELSEHLGLAHAIAIGWSLGASVLWRVLTGPARTRFAGAVVVDMTPRVLNDSDWALGLSGEVCDARAQAIRDDFPSFAASAGAAIFAQPLSEESRPLAAWASEQFARNDGAAIGSLWRSLVAEDLRPLLGLIRQPTLVVHGAQSHLYGSDTADHLVEALPNATAVTFNRSGHAPHLEQPDLFNRTIRDFAASLPPVPQPQTTI